MQLRKILTTTAVVALVCLTAATANAQRQRGQRGQGGGFGGGFGGGQMGGAALLQSSQIQKELELTGDQIEKVKALAEANRDAFTGTRDLTREERTAKFAELQKSQQSKLDEILTPGQRDRFKEISLQVRGAGALSEKDVQEALALSTDQKDQITKIREENRPQRGQGGGNGGNFEELRKAREEANNKVLAVLTSDQKAKFEKMQGKKIEIDRAALRGPGGQGRGRKGANNN